MLSIKNNIMAENAARHLGNSYAALATSVERLSSGLRINTARDDAAGLAVRELMRADIAVLKQAQRNAGDGIGMVQTAEGALGEIDRILVRMKELAEQASTGTYSADQRIIMNNENAELSAEITRIASSAEFNEVLLLNSTVGVDIHVGTTDMITITPEIVTATALSVGATLGTKETHINLRSVASASDEYLSAAEISVATGVDMQFIFQFGTETSVGVDLSAFATVGVSLNTLVDAINDAVEADTGTRYAAAVALYNSDYSSYSLQMQARAAGVGNLVITNSSSVNILDATADFTESQNGTAGGGLTLLTAASAQTAFTTIETAITTKDTYLAKLGYYMKRLEAAESVIGIQAENLLTAESRISDADVATEMATMTRTQVLAQAGVAMLAQANSMPQMALTLLR